MIITVKMWKDIVSFDPVKNNQLDVDGTVKRIAEIKGMTTEEVESMPMEQLLPTYLECVKLVNDTVFSKINSMPKNVETGVGE